MLSAHHIRDAIRYNHYSPHRLVPERAPDTVERQHRLFDILPPEPLGQADLIATRAVLVTIRERVQKMKAAGMTEDQVVAAKPAADVQARRGADDMVSERFVRLVYQTVK